MRRVLEGHGSSDVAVSPAPGGERDLARSAAAAGAETIVALGGDGTWSNVARGILEAGRDTRLALLAGGTGNDLARNVGAPANDIAATLDLAFGERERRIDVGYANGVPFLNCCGVGFDVAVIEALARRGRSLGRSAYLLTAAQRLWRYQPIAAAVGTASSIKPYLVLAIGNGAYFGGGMRLAPDARNDDGILDLIAVRDSAPLTRLRTLLAASRGRHIGRSGVEHATRSAFELRFEAAPLYQVDGELVQADRPSLTVRCERQRLRICVG